jgi:hypothetical protein
LTVVRKTKRRQSGSVVWQCKCVCDKKTYVPGLNLNSGNTTSCGCRGQYPENMWRSMPWIVRKNSKLVRQSRTSSGRCRNCSQITKGKNGVCKSCKADHKKEKHFCNRCQKNYCDCQTVKFSYHLCSQCRHVYYSNRYHSELGQRKYLRELIRINAKRTGTKPTPFTEEEFQQWLNLGNELKKLQTSFQ